MAVRRNHEHSHHCKTSRLSLPSSLSLSLALPRVSSRSISLRKYPWRPASACTSLPQAGSLAIAGERSKGSPVEARIAESVEAWLRGLDSNQDIQLQRLACYRLHHPGPEVLPYSTDWRRGWDSNPEPPIKTRNLLISIAYQDARTARNAGVGYKRGTKT